jgi:hypothetical protein
MRLVIPELIDDLGYSIRDAERSEESDTIAGRQPGYRLRVRELATLGFRFDICSFACTTFAVALGWMRSWASTSSVASTTRCAPRKDSSSSSSREPDQGEDGAPIVRLQDPLTVGGIARATRREPRRSVICG